MRSVEGRRRCRRKAAGVRWGSCERKNERGRSLEDREIVELYWRRDEEALRESDRKYGRLCGYVARNILKSRQDQEECLNDTWFGAWRAMPPKRPEFLSAFLCRITRNLALKKADYNHAEKRQPEVLLSLEELGECVSGREEPDEQVDAVWIGELISEFLWSCGKEQRDIFLRRYWYYDSVAEIAERFGASESKVKSVLFRMRKQLRKVLVQEGVKM